MMEGIDSLMMGSLARMVNSMSLSSSRLMESGRISFLTRGRPSVT